MDRRQRKTRRAVFDAFTELLTHRSYSSITVQEIIDAADVGRSTFYAHFETKDELLRALCAEIFEHVFSEEPGVERTHDFSKDVKDISHRLTHILYHLKDNRSSIRGILSSESGELFMKFFRDYLVKVFERELPPDVGDVPGEYLLNHMVCDFAESVRWWMRHEEYSPEEVSGFFMRTAPFPANTRLHTGG